jgi:hypothetical protein
MGALKPLVNGNTIDEDFYNDNLSEALTLQGLNTIRMLQDRTIEFSAGSIDGHGDAFTSAGGRNSTVDTDLTTAVFDTNKYSTDVDAYATTTYGANYIVFTATSISSISDFAINNCVIKKIADDKWLFGCTVGTDAVRRGQIWETLLYGTTGSNGRLGASYVTGVSAFYSSNASDQGMAYAYAFQKTIASVDTSSTYDGTLNENYSLTSGDLEFWHYGHGSGVNEIGNTTEPSAIEADTGAAISTINVTANAPAGTNNMGTGTSVTASSKTSVTFRNDYNRTTDGSGDESYMVCETESIFLSTQSVSFSSETTSGDDRASSYNATVFTTLLNNITIADTADLSLASFPTEVSLTIPAGAFNSTNSNAIGVPFISDWEVGADINYKLTNASEDSGWLSGMTPQISSFTAFTSEPTTLIVQLVPKVSTPTAGYPSIKGFWVRST